MIAKFEGNIKKSGRSYKPSSVSGGYLSRRTFHNASQARSLKTKDKNHTSLATDWVCIAH